MNQSAALGTSATFTCRGNGEIVWIFGSIQVRGPIVAAFLAEAGIQAEVGQSMSSTSVISATESNNGTEIRCRIETGNITDGITFQESEPAFLLVSGKSLKC